jgi:hypothetical protein
MTGDNGKKAIYGSQLRYLQEQMHKLSDKKE